MNSATHTNAASLVSESSLRVALALALKKRFENPTSVFASEVKYGPTDRRADFVVVDDCSYAFEIKSDFDSLNRLHDQIEDYVRTFDFVSIVTTDRHLSKVRDIVPSKVGLSIFQGGGLTQLRQPKRFSRLSKVHLTMGCNKDTLLSGLPSGRSSNVLSELQTTAIRSLSTERLRGLFLCELRERYRLSSAAFFAETDGHLDQEDLLLLRRASKIAA